MSVIINGTTGINTPAVTGLTTPVSAANGGTGITTTPVAGGVVYGNGTTQAYTSAGTAGGVLYSAGAGAPAFSAAGTSGQVLQSNGSSAPTWATPSIGAMTLISTQTASASSSIAWTGLSTYDTYILIYRNVTLNTGGGYLSYQVGTGATPTYITSLYAGYGYYATSGNAISSSSTSTTSPEVHEPNFGTSVNVNGTITFYNMAGANLLNTTASFGFNNYSGGANAGGNVNSYLTSGTGPYTAIKLLPRVGTFSGTFSLYGISQ